MSKAAFLTTSYSLPPKTECHCNWLKKGRGREKSYAAMKQEKVLRRKGKRKKETNIKKGKKTKLPNCSCHSQE